jgi:hypothetical protein
MKYIIFIMYIDMATYCYKDIIDVKNYYNYEKNKQVFKLDKLDIYNIYKSINIFNNDMTTKILEEYFPLYKLFNIDINKWKDYKYEFYISDLTLTDLDVDIDTITTIQNQFIKYIIHSWENNKNEQKCLSLLILADFLSKTISISNKRFMNTLIKKLELNKKTILNFGIIDINKFNDFLKLKSKL